MKLSDNLIHKIKLHKVFVRSLVPGAALFALAFSMPIFDSVPLWAEIGLGLICVVLFYVWWRGCLSPDKTRFTPKWW